MANVPEDLHYSKEHEWVRVEGDIATVGITDFAQDKLGDVVYLELPRVGETISANQEIGNVESVKAASPIYTPVSGEVIEVNETLTTGEDTAKVNQDPYGKAWMIRVRLSSPGEIDKLMNAAEYEDLLNKQGSES